MDARDFRGLGRPAQEALRRRALYLVEREGMTQAQAARAVGVHRQTVNIWHKRYRERGEDGLLDGRRVSPRRGKGLLTGDEARQVRGWIAEGTPDRLGLPFALWSRARCASWSSGGWRSGSGCHAPSPAALGHDPAEAAGAGQGALAGRGHSLAGAGLPGDRQTGQGGEGRDLLGGRDRPRNQDQVGRSWAPRGETPVVARTAKRVTRSMIAAVSNRGLMRFMLYEGALNGDLSTSCGGWSGTPAGRWC